MNQDKFDSVVNGILGRCERTLYLKGKEYATEDRLHNFKAAADLMGCTPQQALGGFLAKHIISIYDLINSKDLAGLEVWDEKLGDAINYMILLKAIVVETSNDSCKSDLGL